MTGYAAFLLGIALAFFAAALWWKPRTKAGSEVAFLLFWLGLLVFGVAGMCSLTMLPEFSKGDPNGFGELGLILLPPAVLALIGCVIGLRRHWR
jgi:hypothetical protein